MTGELQQVRERIRRLSLRLGIPLRTGTISDEDDTAPLHILRGGNAEGYRDRTAPELLLTGPAGTGKTLALLSRLHRTCRKYPGARALIVRKTRTSLTESALVTFERDVLGPGHAILSPPILRRVRQNYAYPNGSEIIVAGMDKPDRVLSSEYDLIYVQEATEISQEDWETLLGRLRNGAMPYQQMLADCNPTTPSHWLYRRSQSKDRDDKPVLRMVPTTHRDNPRFWNAAARDWTDDGREYLARLDRLTGPRRKRFLEGLWHQAEGLIFEDWNPDLHLIDQFDPPKEWPRYWSIDFGFRHPFVLQCWATDPDGRAYLYREIYRTGVLVEDHARDILDSIGAWNRAAKAHDWSRATEPKPRAVLCDHDAEGRATFERHTGLKTVPADKAVLAGIQDMAERLRVQKGETRPRLFVCRDSLIHPPDRAQKDAGLPTCTREEFDGYVWDSDAGSKQNPTKERPVKEHDDGMDAARYLCKHLARKTSVGILNRMPGFGM